jgi:isopentenyl diphosphate isomerase/L-lactate dehydrogenase-like FMN-dependent dehydrogenase
MLQAFPQVDAVRIGFNAAVAKSDEYLSAPSLPADAMIRPVSYITAFVSYSHADRDFEQRLLSDLETAGIKAWVDHEKLTPSTDDWEREVRRGIAASNGVIHIASQAAAESRYVRDELAIVYDNKITAYGIWADGDEKSSCFPLGWGTMHFADGRGNKYARAVQPIIASLKKANGSA